MAQSKKDTADAVLKVVGLGAVLLRVLRGEDPAKVVAEAEALAAKSEKLVREIERFMGERNG